MKRNLVVFSDSFDLLAALFIALFGAPSGGSSEGRAMWGSLDVVMGEIDR